jgi:hypothetical protein
MRAKNSGAVRLGHVAGHILHGSGRLHPPGGVPSSPSNNHAVTIAAAAKSHLRNSETCTGTCTAQRTARPRLAAICTTWFPQSHADVIVWKLIKGTTTDEGFFPPECEVVSLFLDQCDGRFSLTETQAVAKLGKDPTDEYAAFTAASASGGQDNGRAVAEAAGIDVFPSIKQALCQGSGNTLSVDGVVLIGEHGDYPVDEHGRHMYPRRHLFEQIVGVFAQCKKSVPVFNDKRTRCRMHQQRACSCLIPLRCWCVLDP